MDELAGSCEKTCAEKGSKNKRKEAEARRHVDDNPAPLVEFPRYELLSPEPQSIEADEFGSLEEGTGSFKGEKGLEVVELSDWNDPIAGQLEELLFCNLHAIFQKAIKLVTELGYNEDVAMVALSRKGLYRGDGNSLMNIVEETLNTLMGNEENALTEYSFESFEQQVQYFMIEMISVLWELRPSLTVAEIMWLLIICDLNVSQACAYEEASLGEFVEKDIFKEDSSCCTLSQIKSRAQNSIKVTSSSSKLKISEVSMCKNHTHGYEGPTRSTMSSTSIEGVEITSGLPHSEGKLGPCDKGSRKDVGVGILRRKSMLFEKTYRRTRRTCKGGKLASLDGFIAEKRFKLPSEISSLHVKGTCSSAGTKSSSVIETSMHSSRKTPEQSQGVASSLPTEESYPSTSKKLPEPKPERSVSCAHMFLDYYAGIPYNESLGKYVPQNEKDELILLLVSRTQELLNELESWTEWANKKVMQATRRLGKDRVELKALRQQKEEGDVSKKEKQQLEEKTLKRFFELEKTIAKHNGNFEQATLTFRKYELEKCKLEEMLEEERVNAEKKLALHQQSLEREQTTLKKIQSMGGEKVMLLEELRKDKEKVSDLQKEVDKVRKVHTQAEARLKHESVEKEKLLTKSASMRQEREQMEDRTKAELEKMKMTEAKDMQKYCEHIKTLKDEISVLKLKSEASRITALHEGCISFLNPTMTGKQNYNLSKTLLNFQDTVATGSLGRARECVMCLSEEISVIFLPCAHQVVCRSCNDLHEKEGMKDCPSCRTLIQKRVHARFAARTKS